MRGTAEEQERRSHRLIGELREIAGRALAEGHRALLETEGLAVAGLLGIRSPRYQVVSGAAEAERLEPDEFSGERVVVKVLSREVLHKTERGGVEVVSRNRESLVAALRRMEGRFRGVDVAGYMIAEYVDHDPGPGGELLLGMRHTFEFGPVVTFGAGGTYAEFLSYCVGPDRGPAVFSPFLGDPGRIRRGLRSRAVTDLVTRDLRGRKRRATLDDLTGLIQGALELAAVAGEAGIAEFEVNPLVVDARGPLALDVLALLRDEPAVSPPPRPRHQLRNLLEPHSIAIMGVSERVNPGRVVLRNVIGAGFPREAIHVIKPGAESIDGCSCVPDLGSLPGPVDLLVLSISAPRVPQVLEEVVRRDLARSLILIPGGLGEREGSEELASRIQEVLQKAREDGRGSPLVNGGNCLGVRSVPGRYDTMFIPGYKLTPRRERSRTSASTGEFAAPPTPVAILSQSGAFALARWERMPWLDPRYVVTLGNQVDLTVGDYLAYLKNDAEVRAFACYVEGFRPGDGHRWLEAAAEITSGGRPVVLYRAGRTREGAGAAASHTASIAGDYLVTRELAYSAGALMAESLEEFEDLLQLCILLYDRKVAGLRLGAVSNAGFECVAIADNLGLFELATFDGQTVDRIREVLESRGIEDIVGVQNPLDLTPISNDESFAEAAALILRDKRVDVGVVGVVPMTPALETLSTGEEHDEDVGGAHSLAGRLIRIWGGDSKAWVVVVDGGVLYDPMVRRLARAGVPTFRSSDRALRALGKYCAWRRVASWQDGPE